MGVTLWTADKVCRFELRLGEPSYPHQLANTPDPPETLYGIGDPEALRVGLSVVGARNATPYGIACAERFGGWAAGAGYCVISGAAIGCDQAAHGGALRHGGPTVAVLGCGADVVYPSGSDRLLGEISSCGAVVSELPWGHPPQRWAFRRRNRIIAGLCAALLVVEARLPSGTFSTAEYALDAGRDVFAVPGSILAPECRGPNRLIRQGAIPITDVSDLAMELERLIGPASPIEPVIGTTPQVDNPLLAAVLANPTRPDDLAFQLGMDIVAVARTIGVLESAGLIQRYPDGRYGQSRTWFDSGPVRPRYNAD